MPARKAVYFDLTVKTVPSAFTSAANVGIRNWPLQRAKFTNDETVVV
ncbi:MAG: hypothetical protein ACXVB4_19495 [Pseudobdellovibrionaceae bacterium]